MVGSVALSGTKRLWAPSTFISSYSHVCLTLRSVWENVRWCYSAPFWPPSARCRHASRRLLLQRAVPVQKHRAVAGKLHLLLHRQEAREYFHGRFVVNQVPGRGSLADSLASWCGTELHNFLWLEGRGIHPPILISSQLICSRICKKWTDKIPMWKEEAWLQLEFPWHSGLDTANTKCFDF